MLATLRGLAFVGVLLAAGQAQAGEFKVTSTQNQVFGQEQFANGFGCSGGNLSPQISWENAPEGTKSFAVSMFDPDAPTGSGLWHWVVINVPPTVAELSSGAGSQGGNMPEGSLTTTNDAGLPGYLGVCPPKGQVHRYVVSVKALKVDKLDLPATASGALVGYMTNINKIGEATVTFLAGR